MVAQRFEEQVLFLAVMAAIGEPAQELSFPRTGAGYSHEFAHVGECLAAGLTESPVMPLDDTLAVQQVMAEVLSQLGR